MNANVTWMLEVLYVFIAQTKGEYSSDFVLSFRLYSIYNRLFQMGTVDDMIFVCTTWLYFLVKCIMKEIGLPSFDYNYFAQR